METLLINRMKISHNRIATTPIWPIEAFTHSKSREFLNAVKRNDLKGARNFLMFTSQFLIFEYDDCKQNALIWAAKRNLVEMSLLLLNNFARVDWRDIGGRTALHFAVRNQNLAIVKILLLFKANPGIKSDKLESPLDIC